jgi:hypothetical protein
MMTMASACMFSKNMDQSLVPDAASQFYDNKGQVILLLLLQKDACP